MGFDPPTFEPLCRIPYWTLGSAGPMGSLVTPCHVMGLTPIYLRFLFLNTVWDPSIDRLVGLYFP